MPEWIFYIIGQAFTAGAIYGAIKGDIKTVVMKAEIAHNSASDAHNRINELLLRGQK